MKIMDDKRRVQLQVFAYSRRVLTISASHLKRFSMDIFDSDGMMTNEELWVYNPNTGNTAHFKKTETLRDDQTNVIGWIMKPLPYDRIQYPRLQDVIINVTNE